MLLYKAHKILIWGALITGGLVAIWSLYTYQSTGDSASALTGAGAMAATVAIGFYLRSFLRKIQ